MNIKKGDWVSVKCATHNSVYEGIVERSGRGGVFYVDGRLYHIEVDEILEHRPISQAGHVLSEGYNEISKGYNEISKGYKLPLITNVVTIKVGKNILPTGSYPDQFTPWDYNPSNIVDVTVAELLYN